MSSNVGQNYPYASESEAERAAAVTKAIEAFPALKDKLAAETTPLGAPEESGRWWVWVCPAERDATGRLHVAGYARERHAIYTVCDTGGHTFLR